MDSPCRVVCVTMISSCFRMRSQTSAKSRWGGLKTDLLNVSLTKCFVYDSSCRRHAGVGSGRTYRIDNTDFSGELDLAGVSPVRSGGCGPYPVRGPGCRDVFNRRACPARLTGRIRMGMMAFSVISSGSRECSPLLPADAFARFSLSATAPEFR